MGRVRKKSVVIGFPLLVILSIGGLLEVNRIHSYIPKDLAAGFFSNEITKGLFGEEQPEVSLPDIDDSFVAPPARRWSFADGVDMPPNSSIAKEDACLVQPGAATPEKPKAAWVYLARRVPELCRSLRQLYVMNNCKYQYPIIIFHTDDTLQKTVEERVGHLGLNITYIDATEELKPPPDVPVRPIMWGRKYFPKIPYAKLYPGYQSMCRFWAKKIFSHPAIEGLDYYARLDDDTYLLDPINYDMFALMRKKGWVAAWQADTLDYVFVTQGLFSVLMDFAREKNIDVAKQQADWGFNWPEDETKANTTQLNMIYNNFEIVDVKKYKGHQSLWDLTEKIDARRGNFWGRWGDAPTRYYALALHFNRTTEVHRFCDWGYHHYYQWNKTCDTPADYLTADKRLALL